MFCTAINCMDGRTQVPVNQFMREKTGADYVDTITEPAPVRLLAEESLSPQTESILARIKVSVEKHQSECIAIVAHHDCAGNPVSEEIQKQQLDIAVRFVASHHPYTQILALWVDKNWIVEQTHHLNP